MVKRLLITGLHGTIGPKVAELAKSQGWDVVTWPRNVVDPENISEANLFLFRMNLSGIVHLGLGSERWASLMAHFAQVNDIPFVFSSTVMVFSDRRKGPFTIRDIPDSNDSYGQYKLRCEQAIRNASLKSCILRLGWQIDEDGQGNNMVHYLDEQQKSSGKVSCSDLWIPACTYLSDTADTIMKCINERWYGLFHVDGNAKDGYSYAKIVTLLKHKLNRDWVVSVNHDYVHDQRIKDDYLPVKSISSHLG
ncbi:MAG: sugar nucleotide-binding protein [Succinivibrionaceae bacterium]